MANPNADPNQGAGLSSSAPILNQSNPNRTHDSQDFDDINLLPIEGSSRQGLSAMFAKMTPRGKSNKN